MYIFLVCDSFHKHLYYDLAMVDKIRGNSTTKPFFLLAVKVHYAIRMIAFLLSSLRVCDDCLATMYK